MFENDLTSEDSEADVFAYFDAATARWLRHLEME